MTFDLAYLVLGALLIGVAVLASFVKRWPLTETMIYLVAGALLGPLGAGLFSFDAIARAGLLERLAEIAVIVSLFTAGLKLRVPLRDPQWWTPLRLAFVSMTLTVGFVTLAGVWWLGLPLGAAVLLGAVLAPTDPVLASEVQLANVSDRDRLRFSLTGEAGLNDGTAFLSSCSGLACSACTTSAPVFSGNGGPWMSCGPSPRARDRRGVRHDGRAARALAAARAQGRRRPR